MNFKTWSYRFADQVLNSNLKIKSELEQVIRGIQFQRIDFNRKALNKTFKDGFLALGWQDQPRLFESEDVDEDQEVPMSKIDFLKDRIGVGVAFTHESFLGTDLLKFQTLSYSSLDKMDVGIYIVATKSLQKTVGKALQTSITYEKVLKYLPHFKTAIQVPILVVGLLP